MSQPSKAASILTGVLIVIIGIVLLLAPNAVAGLVGILVGAALLIAAARLFTNWKQQRGSIIASFYLVGGSILGVLGLVCVLNPAGLLNTLGWLVALCIAIAGVGEFVIASRARKEGFGGTMPLITSGLVALLGIFAILNPSIMLQLLGAALVFEGITTIALGATSNRGNTTNVQGIKPSKIRSTRR